MQHKALIVAVSTGLVIILGFLFLYRSTTDVKPQTSLVAETSSKTQQPAVSSDTSYLEYSDEAFSQATQNRRVLFFYANWCPTCQPADKSLREKQSSLPAEVTVFRVNYNDTDTDESEKELARTYGITYQHTFVQVDAEGLAVHRWNGGDIETVISNIK